MYKLKIGIIDDSMKEKDIKRYNRRIKDERYIYISMKLEENINDLIENIILLKLDGLVIDQKLNGEVPGISYNGTDLTKELNKKLIIPYIFWTSNKDSALGVCQSGEVDSVYDHSANSGLTKDSIMIQNLYLKIVKSKLELKDMEDRFNHLLEKKEKDGRLESDELLELEKIDSLLTKSLFKSSSLQDKITYKQLDKIDDLLNDLEKIMEESHE